jgi:hypothetical protein
LTGDPSMSETLPFVVMILIAGGLLVVGAYIARQELGQAESLGRHARERGWSLERHPVVSRALVFKGPSDPVGWRIELYRSGRYQSAMTIWLAEDVALVDGPVLIGAGLDGLHMAEDGELAGKAALNQLGQEFLSRPAGWGAPALPGWLELARMGIDLARVVPQPAGSAAFQEHFSVLAPSLERAQRLLSPQVEARWLDWAQIEASAGLPLVVANLDGLSLRLANDRALVEPQILDRLAALGLALAETICND